MYSRIVIVLLIILAVGCDKQKDQLLSKQHIHTHWEFKSVEDSLWYPAKVPGTVHTDLFENNLIPHPFVKDNELQLQWISETAWEYQTKFTLDKNTLQKKQHRLTFEGLDTYAGVFLNDSLILESNNAFRRWSIDVKHLLQAENTLKVVFQPTAIFETKQQEQLGYELPEGPRIFSRKAQFQYGWDWGPTFNTSGIWRDVVLESWDNSRLEDTYINQLSLDDNAAQLQAELMVSLAEETELTLDVLVSGQTTATHKKVFPAGEHLIKIPFEIIEPQRWWPHNLGDPYLYDLEIRLKRKNKLLDSKSFKKGLRTIEHIAEADEVGESFYFMVNGIPVFMKGANYIPQNSFQNWVQEHHYEQLLNDAVAANMNMLRVWGGGIYENDIFYQKCDEKGLLVWQDFMFACAMYPGDEAFLENVQQEAIDNIKRLRNFTSIALWCGNNEVSEGWHRWGWQDGRSQAEKDEIWGNYLKVFDSILPNTVHQLTNVPYWETSPKFGRGDSRYKTEGNAHDWWIWHDGHPFENLEKNVPRFMSEFGFQGFPSFETIRFINDKDSLDIDSPSFRTHQKHRIGFERILEYMERDFPVLDRAEDYVYLSQLLQAYGMAKGMEAHRRARPYNMGSLYWQLNDCWPVVSWSGIDFLGNWKALHYQAKRSFENVLISFKMDDQALQVYVVNDLLEPQKGSLKLKLLNFYGEVVWEKDTEIIAQPLSSQMMAAVPKEVFNNQEEEWVLKAEFNEETALYYFAKPKDLKLPNGDISIEVTKVNDGFKVELISKVLQKNVFLYTDQQGHFTDNFFDLLPGEIKQVFFKTNSQDALELKWKTLNNLLVQ